MYLTSLVLSYSYYSCKNSLLSYVLLHNLLVRSSRQTQFVRLNFLRYVVLLSYPLRTIPVGDI